MERLRDTRVVRRNTQGLPYKNIIPHRSKTFSLSCIRRDTRSFFFFFFSFSLFKYSIMYIQIDRTIYSSSRFACSMGGHVLRSSYNEFERALVTRLAVLECLRFTSFLVLFFFPRFDHFLKLHENDRLVDPKTCFTRPFDTIIAVTIDFRTISRTPTKIISNLNK